jgi:hypothetical protein
MVISAPQPQPNDDDLEEGLARQVRVIIMPGSWVHPAAPRSDEPGARRRVAQTGSGFRLATLR